MTTADAVMAVVHVKAPSGIDPCAIEAELARAIGTNRKTPMIAELTRADEVRTQSRRGLQHHGFVAVLSVAGGADDDIAKRVQKISRKALHRRFGRDVSVRVSADMTIAEQAAFWCTVRGTPSRKC